MACLRSIPGPHSLLQEPPAPATLLSNSATLRLVRHPCTGSCTRHMTIPLQAILLSPPHPPTSLQCHYPCQKTEKGQYCPVGLTSTSASRGTRLGKDTELDPRNLEGPVSPLLDEKESHPSERRGHRAFSMIFRQGSSTGPYKPSKPTRQGRFAGYHYI